MPCDVYKQQHASHDEIIQAFSLLILQGSMVKLKFHGGEGEGLGTRRTPMTLLVIFVSTLVVCLNIPTNTLRMCTETFLSI